MMSSARILKGSTLWPRAALIRTLDEYLNLLFGVKLKTSFFCLGDVYGMMWLIFFLKAHVNQHVVVGLQVKKDAILNSPLASFVTRPVAFCFLIMYSIEAASF